MRWRFRRDQRLERGPSHMPVDPNAHGLVAAASMVGAHALDWFAGGLVLACSVTVFAWLLLRRGTRAWRARVGQEAPALWPLLATLGFAFAAVVLCGVLLFAAIGARIVPGHPMVVADHALADAVGAHVAPTVLRVFAWLTHAGDPSVLMVLGAAVFAALWWLGRRTLALAWVVALLGNALLNPALKRAFERARPPAEGVFASASGFSFPSGHSSGAIVAYGMLGYIALRTLPGRWQGAALVLATAVVYTTATSRVLLQVHFASDVLAGLASGGTWLVTCIAITEAAAHWRSHRQSRIDAPC